MKAIHESSIPRPSLFPFMSVLVCTMGILMFLAVATTLSSLESARSSVEIELHQPKHHKRPVALECTAQAAQTLTGGHRFEEEAETVALRSSEFEGTPYTDFLTGLDPGQEYVVFLVKPDGVMVYEVLREILLARNKLMARNSVRLAERPAEFSSALKDAGFDYVNARLYCSGVMTGEQRDALKALFTRAESHEAVDRLFQSTQGATSPLDWGSELIPSHWTVHGIRVVEEEEPVEGEGAANGQNPKE